MSNQSKLQKISLIVIGFATVAVFATVGSRLIQPKNAKGKIQEHIAESQKTWDVAFTASFGKNAPDFSVEDIEGKTHKLSDYQGREIK